MNGYTLHQQIGQGGYGVVRRASCKETGKTFAIKSVKHSHLETEDCYEKELIFAWQVDHPSVVRLIETFQDEQQLHFVMELYSGGSLTKNIAARCVNGEARGLLAVQTRRYVWEMLAGIGYLHHHKIVHRDCKPDNYMLASNDDDAALKLIDFGLAVRFHKDKPLTEKVGTPDWTAPEVIRGSYTEKCDIWSVGAVMYLCCVGFAPFTGDSSVQVMKNILNAPVTFNPQRWDLVKPQIKGVVQAMLVKDPACRLSANELASQNEQWLAKVKLEQSKVAANQKACCAIS